MKRSGYQMKADLCQLMTELDQSEIELAVAVVAAVVAESVIVVAAAGLQGQLQQQLHPLFLVHQVLALLMQLLKKRSE